jgi:hypothetical protein
MRKYLTIFEEAVSNIGFCSCSLLNFLIYEKNLIFFFISVDKQCARNRKNGRNLNGDYQLCYKFVPHCVLTQGASLCQYIGAGISVLYISLSFYLHYLSSLRFPRISISISIFLIISISLCIAAKENNSISVSTANSSQHFVEKSPTLSGNGNTLN